MKRPTILLYSLLLACLPVAAALAADPPAAKVRQDMDQTRAELKQLRQQMDQLAKRLARLSRQAGEPAPQAFAYKFLSDPDAGMLGLVLMPEDDGFKVAAVTPGSPAEQAGISHGDRIIRIDGKNVSQNGTARLGALDSIKAGQKVTVRVEHDGKQKDVTLKAEHRSSQAWSTLIEPDIEWHSKDFPHVDVERIVREARDGARQARFAVRSFTPWWGLNLASLDKDLGSYFGTDKGALLLGSDQDALPGLKAGDVITRIGDTKVDRPEDAMRALRHNENKTVTASILRHGKRMQVKVKLPEHPGMIPLPPAPPKPPTPPGPRALKAPAPPSPPSPPSQPDQARAPAPPPPPSAPQAPTPPLAVL